MGDMKGFFFFFSYSFLPPPNILTPLFLPSFPPSLSLPVSLQRPQQKKKRLQLLFKNGIEN